MFHHVSDPTGLHICSPLPTDSFFRLSPHILYFPSFLLSFLLFISLFIFSTERYKLLIVLALAARLIATLDPGRPPATEISGVRLLDDSRASPRDIEMELILLGCFFFFFFLGGMFRMGFSLGRDLLYGRLRSRWGLKLVCGIVFESWTGILSIC